MVSDLADLNEKPAMTQDEAIAVYYRELNKTLPDYPSYYKAFLRWLAVGEFYITPEEHAVLRTQGVFENSDFLRQSLIKNYPGPMHSVPGVVPPAQLVDRIQQGLMAYSVMFKEVFQIRTPFNSTTLRFNPESHQYEIDETGEITLYRDHRSSMLTYLNLSPNQGSGENGEFIADQIVEAAAESLASCFDELPFRARAHSMISTGGTPIGLQSIFREKLLRYPISQELLHRELSALKGREGWKLYTNRPTLNLLESIGDLNTGSSDNQKLVCEYDQQMVISKIDGVPVVINDWMPDDTMVLADMRRGYCVTVNPEIVISRKHDLLEGDIDSRTMLRFGITVNLFGKVVDPDCFIVFGSHTLFSE